MILLAKERGSPGPPPAGGATSVRHGGSVTRAGIAARITGLLRVVAVGGALGTTYLGNTYQSANLVSNLLFELLAAGILSSFDRRKLGPTLWHRDFHDAKIVDIDQEPVKE